MKLFIISPFPPTKGGISTYTNRTVKVLQELGETVEVRNFTKIRDYIENYTLLKTFRPEVTRVEYNIATYGLHGPIIFLFLLYAKLHMRELLLTINFHEVKRDTDMMGIVGQAIYILISRLFDRIYVHTEEAKQILANRCKVSPQKIKVIPLGAYYFTNENYSEKEINEKYELEDKQLILFFGYIHIHKGLDILIEACHKIIQKHPDIAIKCKLVVAGAIRSRKGIFKIFEHRDIAYYEKLKKMIVQYNMSHFVMFSGYTDEILVYSLFKRAKMVVLPYTNTEQSGVLNQAIATDTPVIASSIGGLKETLASVGVLVEPKSVQSLANAMEKCFYDEKFYAQLKAEYLKLNSELSPHAIVRQFVADIKEYKKQ